MTHDTHLLDIIHACKHAERTVVENGESLSKLVLRCCQSPRHLPLAPHSISAKYKSLQIFKLYFTVLPL